MDKRKSIAGLNDLIEIYKRDHISDSKSKYLKAQIKELKIFFNKIKKMKIVEQIKFVEEYETNMKNILRKYKKHGT